ncbi:hypothetical protein JOB18_018369 [Solea senegalensis]|uniref:Uncharacterized protein n=1 Tax=Solea senegalensis TaxID=28829 RepID=A0AAV6SRX0_SOLSE|nr:hypothetical protein JOB18_018369 [Solea senegalensis]
MNPVMGTHSMTKHNNGLRKMLEEELHCSRAVKYPLCMMVKRNRADERQWSVHRR